jgi:hypothetical protein
MTDINMPILDATADLLPPRVQALSQSFFMETEDGIIIRDLSFESLFPGRKSETQKITIVNNLDAQVDMTLTPAASSNQLGSGLDTYLSHYLSLDGINFSTNPLELTIPASSELDFYTYYHPPSNAVIGWKQWLLDVDMDVPALEGWSYTTWFTVTGNGDAIEVPYTLEETVTIEYVAGLMKSDFSDIRFALADHTILDHYIWDKTDGVEAFFQVQLPEVPATPDDVTVYVYSGNPDAEDVSDPTIVQFNEHFPGTSLDLEKWEPNAVGNISYSVNNQLIVTDCSRYVYSQHQSKWDVPSAFNIQYNIISDGLYLGSRFGVGLVKSDDSQIIFVGFYSPINNPGQPEDVILVSEGVWTNVADGWTGSGTNTVSKAFGTSAHDTVFNIEKNGSIISAYVDGTHIADTTIVSTIYRAAIIAYKNGINFNVAQQQVNYIGEADVVTQTPPTVGSMNQSWINTYPIPIKADILFQSRNLPNITPEQRFTAKIGGVLHQ